MEKKALTAGLTVDAVLEEWPETMAVFQAFKTACVGCAMAPFDTLEDVAHIYHLDLCRFMDALRTEIAAADSEAG